jgi:hypothetical protein
VFPVRSDSGGSGRQLHDGEARERHALTQKGNATLKPIIAEGDRSEPPDPIVRRLRFQTTHENCAIGTTRPFAENVMRKCEIVIDENTNPPTDSVADLNSLLLMVGYIELELERVAPDCIVAASHLRSSILNEMLSKSPSRANLYRPRITG